MKGFFEGLQTAPIAEIAPDYGLEVLGPHVRRQEVDNRCLENVFLRFLMLVIWQRGTAATWVAPTGTGTPATRAPACGGRTSCGCVDAVCARSPRGSGPCFFGGRAALPGR
jgi:hypothetical protein